MRNKAMPAGRQGFTLIELIVALATFSLVILAMTGMAFSMIQSQRKSFTLQDAQESSRHILELINKELRTSLVNSADSGGSPVDLLNITNADNETFDYQFDNTNERLIRSGEFVSPDNLGVTGNFYITKSSFPNRSLVTVVMKIRSLTGRAESESEIYLQSTISSRGY